jgi:hypothetical protein
MSQELIYTSAPKGLKPGSRGFCTVASTQGMPAPLAERLESLSGYRPIYPPGSPSAVENPVSYAHWRISIGGKTSSVLSRVAFAGFDYTQRSNKLAHHLVVDAAEQTPAGPAWVLMQPGVMETAWSGEPRVLPAGRGVPNGENPLRVCETWAALAGDAGWAGALVEAFVLDASKPAYIIYEPGTDLLPLINEAIALLPTHLRWQVTFNTFFDSLPAGLTCTWRCCVAGTPAAEEAGRLAASGLRIDLRNPSACGVEGPYSTAARAGAMPVLASNASPSHIQSHNRLPQSVPGAAAVPEIASSRPTAPYKLVAEVPAAEEPDRLQPANGSGGSIVVVERTRTSPIFWAVAILWPLVVAAVVLVAFRSRPSTEVDATIASPSFAPGSATTFASPGGGSGPAEQTADAVPGATPSDLSESREAAATKPATNPTSAISEQPVSAPQTLIVASADKKAPAAYANDEPFGDAVGSISSSKKVPQLPAAQEIAAGRLFYEVRRASPGETESVTVPIPAKKLALVLPPGDVGQGNHRLRMNDGVLEAIVVNNLGQSGTVWSARLDSSVLHFSWQQELPLEHLELLRLTTLLVQGEDSSTSAKLQFVQPTQLADVDMRQTNQRIQLEEPLSKHEKYLILAATLAPSIKDQWTVQSDDGNQRKLIMRSTRMPEVAVAFTVGNSTLSSDWSKQERTLKEQSRKIDQEIHTTDQKLKYVRGEAEKARGMAKETKGDQRRGYEESVSRHEEDAAKGEREREALVGKRALLASTLEDLNNLPGKVEFQLAVDSGPLLAKVPTKSRD